MFKIPEQIKKIAEKYRLSLPKDTNDKTKDIWCVGMNFILKHDAVSRIANHEGVEFFEPRVEITDVIVAPDHSNDCEFNVTIEYEIVGIDVLPQELSFALQSTR